MSAQSTSPSAGPWLPLLGGFLLALATFLAYGDALDGEFIYDDVALVQNAEASQSIGAAIEGFMSPLFANSGNEDAAQRGVWRPLTVLAFAVGRALGGGEPFGFHLVSLLVHVAAAVAVFRLGSVLLRQGGAPATTAEVASFGAALLFALHPSHVESVAWISAVNDPLWATLGLCALLAHERASRRGSRVPLLAMALTLVALLAKESAVVLVPVAAAMDLALRRGGWLGRALWMLAPLAIWYGIRAAVFGDLAAGFGAHGDFNLGAGRDLSLRLELFGGFIGLAFWPADPQFFRPVHPVLPDGSSALAVAGVASALWAAALLIAWRTGRRLLAFGLLAFALSVLPFVLAPDRAGLYPLSDRYAYFGIGLLTIGLASLLGRAAGGVPWAGASAALAVLGGVIVGGEIPGYANQVAFSEMTTEDAPRAKSARWQAGNVYFKRFLETENSEFLTRSFNEHALALRLGWTFGDEDEVEDPDLSHGERFYRLQRSTAEGAGTKTRDHTVLVTDFDEYQSLLGYLRALTLLTERGEERDFTLPLGVLEGALASGRLPMSDGGVELHWLHGRLLISSGDLEGARKALGEALRLNPGHVPSYKLLAQAQLLAGDPQAACMALESALEYAPADVDLLTQYSIASEASGQIGPAAKAIERALAAGGRRSPQTLVQSAVVDFKRGRVDTALGSIDRALSINPDFGPAYKARGTHWVRTGDLDRALSDMQRAAELIPDDFAAHYQLAAMLLRQRPGPDDGPAAERIWRENLLPIMVRAYMFAPPAGAEQLALGAELDALVGSNADAAYEIGSMLRSQRRDLLAVGWLERAADLSRAWPMARQRSQRARLFADLGLLLRGFGRTDDAIAAFQNATDLNPDLFKARYELGVTLSVGGAHDRALPHLEAALRLLPSAGVKPEQRGAVEAQLEAAIARARGGSPPSSPGE